MISYALFDSIYIIQNHEHKCDVHAAISSPYIAKITRGDSRDILAMAPVKVWTTIITYHTAAAIIGSAALIEEHREAPPHHCLHPAIHRKKTPKAAAIHVEGCCGTFCTQVATQMWPAS